MTAPDVGFEGLRATECAISEAAAKWPCQSIGGGYVAGVGYVFTYCPQSQAYLAAWSTEGRRYSSQQRYVCREHGEGFAQRHGLTLPGAAVPLLGATTEDPFADADQPYARVRGAK